MANRAQHTVLLTALGIGFVLAAAATSVYILRAPATDIGVSAFPTADTSVQALDQSAEERAYQAIQNIQNISRGPDEEEGSSNGDSGMASQKANASPSKQPLSNTGKQAATDGRLPATTLALNCERLRKAYSDQELGSIPGFKEKCKE
ncbi:hypothetical protein SAMN05518801_13210 [Novosphingobium sp. CF614]|uniref:hypothetical protein n=1 Tax=Novosphingobium sp. CF614 TaxID=1884364 RepID=UPI0008E9E2BF|nr:hypothetical protein [Novosphingobium sp. CF614]SFG47664.1 hypothetical protein SAMN05518801_13210 [Novosphingobium sp. CF614]